MARHRRPTPIVAARRQLAIAGLGVVAAGGVIGSQLAAPAYLASGTADHGSPTDIPTILTVEGNSVTLQRDTGGNAATGGDHGNPADDVTRESVRTVADTTAATTHEAPSPTTPTSAPSPTAESERTAPPAGDAMAMLDHSKGLASSTQASTTTDETTSDAATQAQPKEPSGRQESGAGSQQQTPQGQDAGAADDEQDAGADEQDADQQRSPHHGLVTGLLHGVGDTLTGTLDGTLRTLTGTLPLG